MHTSSLSKAAFLATILFCSAGCRRGSPAASVSSARAAASLPAAGSHTLYVEPDAGLNWLSSLVNSAHRTVDMTMYELVDPTLSGDLVSACGRGVRVRVILDQNRERAANTAAYHQLNSAGSNCQAAWANPQFAATHQKSLVLDDTTAVIASLNLTSRYYPSTRDVALVEHDAADIRALDATFNSDFGSTTDLAYQPAAGDDLLWSPTTAQAALLKVIQGARKTLLVENEEMSSAAIVNALESACARGVAVHIAMTDTSASYHANYKALQVAGCSVHVGADNSATLYIHAKAMVADLGTPEALGYLGSVNFSDASLTRNRELGVYVFDGTALRQLGDTMAKDYASFPEFL